MIDGHFEYEYDELDEKIDRHIEGMYLGHVYDEEYYNDRDAGGPVRGGTDEDPEGSEGLGH